mmetsp:Transcript_2900/g.8621  ORF Transcript_2900/g.8621 Transcript_2900/m.8621 type:complete len:407 (-) Transcript_2900:753-1973(-)
MRRELFELFIHPGVVHPAVRFGAGARAFQRLERGVDAGAVAKRPLVAAPRLGTSDAQRKLRILEPRLHRQVRGALDAAVVGRHDSGSDAGEALLVELEASAQVSRSFDVVGDVLQGGELGLERLPRRAGGVTALEVRVGEGHEMRVTVSNVLRLLGRRLRLRRKFLPDDALQARRQREAERVQLGVLFERSPQVLLLSVAVARECTFRFLRVVRRRRPVDRLGNAQPQLRLDVERHAAARHAPGGDGVLEREPLSQVVEAEHASPAAERVVRGGRGALGLKRCIEFQHQLRFRHNLHHRPPHHLVALDGVVAELGGGGLGEDGIGALHKGSGLKDSRGHGFPIQDKLGGHQGLAPFAFQDDDEPLARRARDVDYGVERQEKVVALFGGKSRSGGYGIVFRRRIFRN